MATQPKPASPAAASDHFEDVEIAGHIIDSLILPKVLDTITASGGTFRIKRITVGQARSDPSYALVEVRAGSAELLARILAQIADHGAVPTTTQDCRLVAADMDGAFPEGFLQHDQPADRGAARRRVGRGGRPGDGLRHGRRRGARRRPAACR